MIEEGRGNLLTADVDALVNTVNTVGVMGKGVALQFKRAYPDNYRAYRAACERGEVRLGSMFVVDTGVLGFRRWIVNFPTKGHWRGRSRLGDIEAGLDDLLQVVREREISSIAIPALGCGNGGLEWDEVRPLIESALARIPDVRALVFAPAGAPAAATMPNATPKPRLTPLRAQLVGAVHRYLERARLQEVRDGVSELEIQKLAYFLQVLGAPLRLSFVRGTYGPYSPQLGHVLDQLEGHYLTGYGDRSARVSELVPITPIPGAAAEESARGLSRHPDDQERIESLLRLVDGFETPYSLELLATSHFAAHQAPPTGQPVEMAERVAAWSLRKARLFTEDHVRIAAERLAEKGLLPPPARTVPDSPRGLFLRAHRDEIMRAAADHGASNVRLFGSTARGDDRPDSDIDLLVHLDPDVGLFGLVRLRGELERILGAPVDIVPDDGLKPEVRGALVRDLVPL